MDAGVYLRLSEAKDTEEGTEAAYERFETGCRQLCDRRGWTIREVYREPIGSAYKSRKRTEFARALADLKSGRIKALVAIEWTRLSRNRQDTAALWDLVENHGAIVATADGSDTTTRAGRQALEIKGLTAKWESDEISERVKRQQEQSARKGGPPPGGRRLYGYSKGRTEVIEEEAAVVRELVRRLLAGESVRQLRGPRSTTLPGRT